jgi:hypothetical protein
LTASRRAHRVGTIVSRWDRKPVMQRTLRDDARWGLLVLLGATLAWLLLGADDPGVLLGAAVGIAIAIVVMNVVRRGRDKQQGPG